MFTRSSLTELLDAAPRPGVSIFLPTHLRGREIRQDPIRLRNLLAEAREGLGRAGLQPAQADGLLAPAQALVEDYGFWQHQDQGLALFLDDGGMRRHKVPIPLAEKVVVGPRFHLRPLLPALARDSAFHVLTITADAVRLFDASRFAMVEDEGPDLPRGVEEVMGDPDYQNPLQASPAGRPHTASITVTKAQVYGDSPEDWRKGRLVEFLRRTGTALEAHLTARPAPVVLVADAEVQGHFRKLGALGPRLAGVVEANPESLAPRELHAAAYEVMRPMLDAGRRQAIERFAALRGSGDGRAVEGPGAVAEAAQGGRVDTLLLTPASGDADDLLDLAAAGTLRNGGEAFVLPAEEMPGGAEAAAILRY